MKEDLQMASVAPDPSPHLAAAFTILDPAGLATYLQGLYDLEAPVSCELLEGGVNDTYLVRTAAGSRVYRLYRLGWRNAAEVVWELALLDYLREQAAEVSAPLLDRTGAFQHVIHVPEVLAT